MCIATIPFIIIMAIAYLIKIINDGMDDLAGLIDPKYKIDRKE